MVFYYFRKFFVSYTDVSQIPGHRFALTSIVGSLDGTVRIRLGFTPPHSTNCLAAGGDLTSCPNKFAKFKVNLQPGLCRTDQFILTPRWGWPCNQVKYTKFAGPMAHRRVRSQAMTND